MSAEATTTSLTGLAALAAAVDLCEVRPLAFLARLVGDLPQQETVFDLSIKNELTSKQEGDGQFVVSANFTIGAKAGSNSKQDFLEIRYNIVSRYRVPSGHPLEQDVLDLFAKTNGMVHLWPYLRAFVANSCAQMGLIPITLPPFRVKSSPEQPSKEPSPAASS